MAIKGRKVRERYLPYKLYTALLQNVTSIHLGAQGDRNGELGTLLVVDISSLSMTSKLPKYAIGKNLKILEEYSFIKVLHLDRFGAKVIIKPIPNYPVEAEVRP